MVDPVVAADLARQAVELVERLSGQVIPPYRWPLVEDELAALGRQHGLVGGVRRLLGGDPAARTALLETLSVPETYLFRHVGHFELLDLVARRRAGTGRATRVLCAGCSTGEEVWSAAAVLDAVPAPAGCGHQVIGWDLCRDRLEQAAEGRFASWAVRRGLYRWGDAFDYAEGRLTVNARLRRMVRFDTANLVTGRLPAASPVDVVMFRNVAIYFRERVAHEVSVRLAGLLAEDGVLMVAASDPVALPPEVWQQRIEGGARWFERRRQALVVDAKDAGEAPPVRSTERSRPTSDVTPPAARVAGPARSAPFVPAPLAPTGTALERIQQLADLGRYGEGLELLRGDPVADTVEGRLWQGILLMALEHNVEAVRVFRQCVFLCPEDPEPRRWLAAAFESVGEDAAAERERRNVRQLEAS